MGVSHRWHLCGAVCVQGDEVWCVVCGLRVIGCIFDTYRAERLDRLCFDLCMTGGSCGVHSLCVSCTVRGGLTRVCDLT